MNSKKVQFILITLCMLTWQNVFSQAPQIEWQNTIGGNAGDVLQTINHTSDGGCILGGSSSSGISGDKTEANLGAQFTTDYWVVKVNATGVIEWENTIGGSDYDFLSSIQETSDGGYILGGNSSSEISGDKTEAPWGSYDYWVVKLNATGTIEWQNTIGGSNIDFLNSIQQTSDGGYILGGSSRSGISGDKTEASLGKDDYWVVKLNATGTIEWQNTIGGSKNDYLNSIQQTSDGGYILGGKSVSEISGDKTEVKLGDYDYWVVKLAATGTIEWQNTIGGTDLDELFSIRQTSDGGYILGGGSHSAISGDKTEKSLGEGDYWVVKLNSDGSIEWQNTIGGNTYDYFSNVQQTADGGYILGGSSRSGISGDKTEASSGGNDYWVVKLNDSGNIEWQKAVGGTGDDGLAAIEQTADGSYFLGGHSYSPISGDKTEANQGSDDYWLVKLYPYVCNGLIVFADADNDGFGNAANSFFAADCIAPEGYVINNSDCNDADTAINPSMTEVCGNAIDDNCNGQAEEDCICAIPSNLSADDITTSTVGLHWNFASNAISYKVRYKVKKTDTWTITIASASSSNKYLTGLTPNTEYAWQVKTHCETYPVPFSDWSTKEFFTTAPLKIGAASSLQTSLEIYPNPSLGDATIHFSLSQSSQVTVKIFDINGKEMSFPDPLLKTPVNQTLDAGNHFFSINTTHFSKGIYFVQVITENEILNQKLIVQ